MSAERAPDGTAFDLHGPEDAPLIALIHGLGLSRRLWDAHIPALSERHRVLNYDLYGHGDSAPLPREATLSLYSDQLARLMDHLSLDRAAVVGFSIGGMINRRFALDHPERLSALVILNSPHDRGKEPQKAVEARAATVRDQGAMATMDAALARWFTPEFLASRPDAIGQVKAWRQQADADSYAGAAWVLAAGVTELIRPSPPIRAPALIMTCENDSGSTPAMSEAIAAEIDGAFLTIVPHLKHLGLMEAPEAFTGPVLSFLNGIKG